MNTVLRVGEIVLAWGGWFCDYALGVGGEGDLTTCAICCEASAVAKATA